MTRLCPVCGKSIDHRRSDAQTCGSNCRARLTYRRNSERILAKQRSPKQLVDCSVCGHSFLTANRRATYCRRPCRLLANAARRRKPRRECVVCGGYCERLYCGKDCKWKAHYARKKEQLKAWTQNWWGNMTPEERRLLRRKYKAVAARDPMNVAAGRDRARRWQSKNRERWLVAMRNCQIRRALNSVPLDVREMRMALYELNSDLIFLKRGQQPLK